jgi:hypothetical protein
MQNEDGSVWPQIGHWAWENKEWIFSRLVELRRWLFQTKEEDSTSSILIIGPGGVGKSTCAKMLSGQCESLLEIPSAYQESINLERFVLEDDNKIEIIVPPGQRHRRDTTWTDLEQTISTGGYRGIIITGSYGYHSIGEISYKHHRLYKGNDASFLSEFLLDCRTDELNVLKRLMPHIRINKRRTWILTLICKQDLWWDKHAIVDAHYRSGEYGSIIDNLLQYVGRSNLRNEYVFSSLLINNFTTGLGELLASTVAGYDNNLQVNSLHRLWETLNALKNWEEQK